MKSENIRRLLYPSSIAIAGAGNNLMKMGTMHALSIINDGYAGRLYPVHPREKDVLGLNAWPSVAALPEIPDLAFIVVPSSQVPALLDDFGRKGTKSAVIISAGFGEMGGRGAELESEISSIAVRHGMTFIGPNCMGIINTGISLNTTVMQLEKEKGRMGFVSQSGTYITQSIAYLRKRGIRFSKAVSVGNQANTDLIDILEYLGADDDTKAVGLYIEGLKDLERFLRTASEVTRIKPVIAQYVGGSEAGARSGKSHTGALAGPDYLYDGIFKQAGIIRVGTIEELYSTANLCANQPPLCGRRIGIITNSGGPASAIADRLEREGLEVPPFSAGLSAAIKPLMPEHAPAGNPVDLTFSMDISLLTEKIPAMVSSSGEVDGIVLHGAMSSGFIKEIFPHYSTRMPASVVIETLLDARPNKPEQATGFLAALEIPVTVSSFFDRDDDYTRFFQDRGVPVFDSPEKAAAAMGVLRKCCLIKNRPAADEIKRPVKSEEASAIIKNFSNAGALDEYSSKRILSIYGIEVSRDVRASSEDDLGAALEVTGYPLAIKVSDPEFLHKTERGLLALNISSKEEAFAAYRGIQAKAGRSADVIVSPMLRGPREFIAGFTRKKNYGSFVLFGIGGIFTEALNDIVFRMSPLPLRDCMEMQREIRGAALLGPVRNMPPVDMDKTAALIQTLGFIGELHPEISEIDVNPVMIEDGVPVAADALIVLENQ